jgi:hypothetical protein
VTPRLPRLFASCCIALAGWLAAGSSPAAVTCRPTDVPGVEHCEAGLTAARALQLQETQRASEWCWAASIAMVLRHHGVDVQQEEVVRAYWGSATNLGIPLQDVSPLLRRTWQGRVGSGGAGSVLALPGPTGGVGDAQVLEDLEQGWPVVVGTPRHVMLLVQVTYERSAGGVRVLGAVVLDPAPGGGRRAMHDGERSPAFVLRVHAAPGVQELPARAALVSLATPGTR